MGVMAAVGGYDKFKFNKIPRLGLRSGSTHRLDSCLGPPIPGPPLPPKSMGQDCEQAGEGVTSRKGK